MLPKRSLSAPAALWIADSSGPRPARRDGSATATARNWRTVIRLLELATADD